MELALVLCATIACLHLTDKLVIAQRKSELFRAGPFPKRGSLGLRDLINPDNAVNLAICSGGEHPGGHNHQDFPKALQYKWEAYCDTNGGSTLAHRNRSDFCDLRLRCPSRTPEIAAISETRESNAALRFRGAMESR